MNLVALIGKIFVIVLVLGLTYVAVEVGLYLNWAVNREPGEATDFGTYANENEGGLMARYCG